MVAFLFYGDNIHRARDLSAAFERAHDLLQRSKLSTRKRGRSTVSTLSVALLFHFIGRLFSVTLWLGSFKFGARGFTVDSACAGGLVIELGDAYGVDIVVTRIQSRSLFCNFIERMCDARGFAVVSACTYDLAIEANFTIASSDGPRMPSLILKIYLLSISWQMRKVESTQRSPSWAQATASSSG